MRLLATFMRRMKGLMLRYVPGLMTCREVDEMLMDYVDGRLDARAERFIRLHLRMCPACRQYLEDYRAAMEMGRRAFTGPDAPGRNVETPLPPRLVEAVLAARRDSS